MVFLLHGKPYREAPRLQSPFLEQSRASEPTDCGWTWSRWLARAMKSCAAVRASPLAWCGRWTGSPMPAAAVDKPGAASTATWGRSASAAARRGTQAASTAVSSVRLLRRTPRRFKVAERKPTSTGAAWATRTRPVSASRIGSSDSSNRPGRTVVSDASPMIALPRFTGTQATEPISSCDLVVLRVGTGHLESQDGERRLTPGDGRGGRRRPQVALHGPGVAFDDDHHAKARPELKLQWSLLWTARTSLRASRSRRRLAGSIALGSR